MPLPIPLQKKWVYNDMISMKSPLTLKTGLAFTLSIAVLALVGYNMRDRILGTPLIITTAQNGSTVSSATLPIAGIAKHARELLINGRAVTVDREGSFSDEILLSPGYNIVEVALKDQFGNQKVKTYQLVVNAPEAVAAAELSPYQ